LLTREGEKNVLTKENKNDNGNNKQTSVTGINMRHC